MEKQNYVYVILMILKGSKGPAFALKAYTTEAKARHAKANIMKNMPSKPQFCKVAKVALV